MSSSSTKNRKADQSKPDETVSHTLSITTRGYNRRSEVPPPPPILERQSLIPQIPPLSVDE